MTSDTEEWLGPMLKAQLDDVDNGAAFLHLLESAVSTAAISGRGVNWLQFGQLLRQELGWDDYPASPARRREVVC